MHAYPWLVSPPPAPAPAPFCANGPFQVRWLMIVPQRHWHGTATALRWDCHLSAAAPTRHYHSTGTPPHLLYKRTVFGALVDDSPAPALARHAPAVRRECYWTATGPQRQCHGNAAAPTRHGYGTGTPPHILCKRSVSRVVVDVRSAPALTQHMDTGDGGDTCHWKDDGDDGDYSDDFYISIIETARAAATPPLGRGGTC